MDNNGTKPRKPLRILFMHGLESGPGGSKDRYLRQHFEDVRTPDMKMSLYRLTKSNSVARNALRRPLFLGWATAATVTLPLAWLTYGLVAISAWAAVFVAVLAAIRRPLIRQALAASLDRCVAVQADAIGEFRPEVVIGSSWGSVVALMCTSRGVYSGPQLLIAPPLKLVFDKLGDSDGSRHDALCKGLSPDAVRRAMVVHGTEDATVPVEHSHLLAAATGVKLKILPGGHRLNSALLGSAEGPGTSERFEQMITEVAAQR